jgi:uncharacterized membrane protein YccC
MNAPAAASAVSTRFEWPLQSLLTDLRVQYGTKMGLAGLLALYCAQVLRLQHPNWSILTVVVMMNSQYVGSITVKAILRVGGTICGGLLGIWLVGSYASAPAILLTAMFFNIAFATYKFGQYPASQTPYFHFLVGLTLLTVATYGVDAPDQIWETGINRMLETLVGALCALVVTSVVWPRYAREEFFQAGRSALETASKLLAVETDAYIHGQKVAEGVEQIRQTFAQQLSTLRNLLQAGARESTYFRARLANYHAFLVSLTDLFPISAGFGSTTPGRITDFREASRTIGIREWGNLGRVRNSNPAAAPPREFAAKQFKSVFRASGRENQRAPKRTK